MTTDDGKINIKGCADSVEDVYVFFKILKILLLNQITTLSKLDLKAGSLDTVVNSTVSTIDTAPYIFEITNMNDAQLKSFFSKLADGNKSKSSTPAVTPAATPASAATAGNPEDAQ